MGSKLRVAVRAQQIIIVRLLPTPPTPIIPQIFPMRPSPPGTSSTTLLAPNCRWAHFWDSGHAVSRRLWLGDIPPSSTIRLSRPAEWPVATLGEDVSPQAT